MIDYFLFKKWPPCIPISCVLVLAAFSTTPTRAGVLAGWDVRPLVGGSNNFGPSPLAATTTNPNLTVGGLTRGGGVGTTGTAAARAWGGNAWQNTSKDNAITGNDFATFTVTANSGNQMSLSSISRFDYRRSSTGPANGVLQYQVGGGAFTDITTLGYASTAGSGASLLAIDLSGIPALQNIATGSTVTFRIVNFGGTSAGGTWYVFDVANSTANDLELSGTVSAVSSACGDPATKISAVQGSGASTPLNGVAGTSIEGIVVGDYQGLSANSLRGFFVQEENADVDGNPATSEGIFVFDGNTGSNPPSVDVNVGDKVRVAGTPTEFSNMTQIGTVANVQVCSSGHALPTPATLTLPVPSVPNGDLTIATHAINGYYEAFEGMLVTFPAKLSVAEYFQLERYGQLVLSQGGRIPTFTSVKNPSLDGLVNHRINLAKRRIILDDKNNIQNFSLTRGQPLPYPTGGLSITNRFRGGDTINNLTGVLSWSFAGQAGTDAWRIRPVEERFTYNFVKANPRKPNPPKVGGTLQVASFNVLNYFTTIDTTSGNSGPCAPGGTQDCRGADSAAELIRQTDKAAAALCGMDADIIGLMEMENNATASLSGLVAAMNGHATCTGRGDTYAFIDTGTIGTDAIKVGLLYKPATVSPVHAYAVLDSSAFVTGGDSTERNRPALAQSFLANGQTVTVVVNHLKSKGSACDTPDANDGQGNCNQVRTRAANALIDWLGTSPTGVTDPDFLIIGDLNSYAQEDPIKAIEAAGYTNLVKKFGGKKAYSFVFDGQTGYLDYALANASLTPQVTGSKEWHINADEPPSFDYNDTIRDTGEASFEAKPSALPLYEANPFRSSDHDPVIVGLQLGGVVNTINGTPGKDTLVGTAGKDRITGFARADTLTGNGGNDEFVFTSTLDGIDTITDFIVGEDKIDLAALLTTIGYERADPITDGMVQFANSGSNAVVFIDTDGAAGPARRRILAIVQGVSAANLSQANNFTF